MGARVWVLLLAQRLARVDLGVQGELRRGLQRPGGDGAAGGRGRMHPEVAHFSPPCAPCRVAGSGQAGHVPPCGGTWAGAQRLPIFSCPCCRFRELVAAPV